jgi:hypothetical protein
MASDKQIQANRENAKRSTGPKTPEGKARAAANSLRHGFRARNAVLPEEDRDAYLELIAALEAEHRPSGPLETFLVREMALAQWRLERITRIETGFLTARIEHTRERQDTKYDPPQHPNRTQDEAIHDEDTRIMGIAFGSGCAGDPIGKFNRYENSARRAFYKALKTLRESQANRRPPAAQQELPNEPNSAPEDPVSPEPLHAAQAECRPARRVGLSSQQRGLHARPGDRRHGVHRVGGGLRTMPRGA